MSQQIDEKIVALKLNNKNFEANAKRSLGTLSELSKNLNFSRAVQGLSGFANATRGMLSNLTSIRMGADGASNRLSAMGIVGVTALATLANKAVNFGINMAKSLAFDPIKGGFAEYELKLGSIQTMLANTARYGTKLPEVSRNLDELNDYADKTIYSFGDMTRNIGFFTNSGLRIGDATKMIQGFSNVAAASGTSASGAAGAAYQLSQALSAGKVTLMDWRSLTNVGMGNKNMQTSIIELSKAMGTMKDTGTKLSDVQRDFNGSLKSGWLTADVMSEYLKIMATDFDSLTAKEVANQKKRLEGLGLSKKVINSLIEEQKMAQKSATEVRTFTQLVGTVKESIGSGWAQSFEIIIGNFSEATKLWTDVNDRIGETINKMSDSRNALLKGWAKHGGRVALIEGLGNAFEALSIVIKAVKDGFQSVFPPMTGKRLADITKSFRDFTESLKMGGENADRLKRTFAGVFTIFKIGWTIIKSVFSIFLNLFGIAQGGAGGFLALTAAVGDFLVRIEEWLVTSGRIKDFFSVISTARATILVPLIAIVGKIAEAFASLLQGDYTGFMSGMKEAFAGLGPLIDGVWKNTTARVSSLLATLKDATGIAGEFLKGLGIKALEPIQKALTATSEKIGQFRDAFRNFGFAAFEKGASGVSATSGALSAAADKIAAGWAKAKEGFASFREFLGPFGDSIGNLFLTITDKIASFIENMDMNDAISVINTAFFIMAYKSIRDFMKNIGGLSSSFKGIADSIGGTFDQVKSTLTSFSDNLDRQVKINAILKIAIAIGILAVSLKLLSTIEPEALARSLGAVGAMLFALTLSMNRLMGMMSVVEGQSPVSAARVLAAGGALMLLAGAVLLLSVAVKKLSSLSWGELAKGLVGVGVLLTSLALFTRFASVGQGTMKGAMSLVILAGAIYLLSYSVEKLGQMNLGNLVKGVVAVSVLIQVLGVASTMMGLAGPKGAGVILAMALALGVLAGVVMLFGNMDIGTLAKGMIAVAASLVILAVASNMFGSVGLVGSIGIMAMAVALGMLAPVIMLLGQADISTLAKGVITIAVAIGVLAAASMIMGNPMALAGAAGVLAMAAALTLLAPVILLLGQADLSTLAVGLGAMAVAFGIFIVAGAAAAAIAPGLMVLGTSLLLVGAAMALAGVGMALFAAGFATLVALGTAGFAVLAAGFTMLMNLIPLFAQQIGHGLIAIAVVIGNAAPKLVGAMTKVLISILKAIEKAAPQFFSTMSTLILGLVKTVARLAPQLAHAGANMIVNLLRVLTMHVPRFARAATDFIIAMINAIAREVPRLADAGAKAVIKLVNGVADAIRNNTAAMNAAGRNLASAIVEGMASGISGGIGIVKDAAMSLARNALGAAKNFLGIKSPSREFAKLGKYSAQGFAKGLRGNKEDIKKAIKEMTDLVKQAKLAAAEDIKGYEARLKKLNKNRRKNAKEIIKVQKALRESRREYARAVSAQNLMKTWGDETKKLNTLASSADKVATKLADAKKKLEDAQKTRDDFKKSTKDQYSALPSFESDTSYEDYIKEFQKKIVDTKVYNAQLQRLRKMGLNDAMYEELIKKGPDAIPFAKEILEGGANRVKELNALKSSLNKEANTLGTNASKNLYQAAVDSAAGIVKGLQKQQANIQKQMNKIADGMVRAIKKRLGIKSPSKVFSEVGSWSVKGLTKGLEDTSKMSQKAASKVGSDTIESMRKSLTGLSDVLLTDLDVDPTIRPVLDLTDLKRDAIKMGAIIGGNDLQIGASVAKARINANDYASNQLAKADYDAALSSEGIVFNQYNNSPKALSEATIYRQTKNQISAVKGALNT